MADSDQTPPQPTCDSHLRKCLHMMKRLIVCVLAVTQFSIWVMSLIVYAVADEKVIDKYSLRNEYNAILSIFWVQLAVPIVKYILEYIILFDDERKECCQGLKFRFQLAGCVVLIYYYGVLWDNYLKNYMPVYELYFTTLRSSVIPHEFKNMWVYTMMCIVVKVELGLFIIGLIMAGLSICRECCGMCLLSGQEPNEFSDPLGNA